MNKIKFTILILLIINFIFTYKYSSRISEFGIYIAALMLVFQYLVWKFEKRIKINNKIVIISVYVLLIFLILFVIISHYYIPKETLNVDRWSVISSFIDTAIQRKYPYSAISHLGNPPGPMPFYFIIALPFYLMNMLSLLSFLGYTIIIFVIIRKLKSNHKLLFISFFLITATFMYWEIVTRSNIFSYSVLIVLILLGFEKINKEHLNFKFCTLAIAAGLLLSTRGVFILVYIIFALSSFINNNISIKKLLIFSGIALVGFGLTFLPLLIYFSEKFFELNPLIIQSSFLMPRYYVYLFLIISILLSLIVKNNNDKFFYSGLSLFVTISIYSTYHLIFSGYHEAFVKSKIDISYFLFCVPFFLMFLIKSSKLVEENNASNILIQK